MSTSRLPRMRYVYAVAVVISSIFGVFLALRSKRAVPASSSARAIDGPQPHGPSALKSPPLFTSAAPRLQLTPGAPGYDPTKLRGIVPIRNIFAAEPRLEPWASRVEASLKTLVASDFSKMCPGASLEAVECRTTSCRISWKIEAKDAGSSECSEFMPYLFPPAVSVRTQTDYIFALYGGHSYGNLTLGDGDAAVARLMAMRTEILGKVRSGKGIARPRVNVSADQWPLR